MKPSFRNLGFLVLASCAALALAQDTWTLKRVAKVGDTASFRMSAEMEFSGMPITFTAKVIDKVTEMKDTGEYAVESTSSDVKITMPQGDQEMPGGPATTVRFGPTGEVLAILDQESNPDAWRYANLMAFRYPATAVKVGDEWTYDLPGDTKTGAVAAKATFKLEAIEKVGAVDALKIKTSVKETAGSTPASSEGYAWLDPKSGDLVKSEMAWTDVPVPGGMPPISAKVKMVKEG